MQALPNDIRNLPNYFVPVVLFVCTSILLIIFTIISIVALIHWIYRTYHSIYNPEYIVDHDIVFQFETTKKNIPVDQQAIVMNSQQNSQLTKYTPELQLKARQFNRMESRMLQFVCLSVIVAININSFSSQIMETVAYFVAIIVFIIFNLIRIPDDSRVRWIFMIPLLVCYVPFYIFPKKLTS